jgi:non-specific serine/threonine protein kinase
MRRRRLGTALLAAAMLAALILGGCTTPSPPSPDPSSLGRSSPSQGAAEPGWIRLASAPSARTEVAAAVAGGRIHVVGGYRADGATVATVEVFDPATGAWQRGPDLPVALNHAMAATIDDALYVFGGYRHGNIPNADAFRLEPAGWRAVARMPDARAAGTAVPAAGRAFVVGGIATGNRLAQDMLVYAVAADRWSTGPGPPTPREHLGGAAFDGRIYVVGGRSGGLDGNLAAFESFDPVTGQWSRLPDLPTRRGGLAAAATWPGEVVAVGGEAEATFAEVEAFDVRSGRWRALPPLPTPRHGLGVVAIGTMLYTLAGGPRPGLFVSDAAEAIDLRVPGSAC